QVPVASEKEKGETWFERKATELVENYIQSYGPQQKKSKEAAEIYTTACKNSEQAQEDFISALQKTQEKAEVLQKCLGRALEAAMAFGREEERAQQYAQAKDKCSRPFWGIRARKQPAEEEPGKEWREKISEDVWKVGRLLKEDERYLECTYYPFSPEWQEKLREELLTLASRGFGKKEDGELYPTRRFGWQLRSTREFESINQSLERDYGVRLVWKSQEVKGRSKSVDDFHCYLIGRGKMEKVSKYGVQYTVLGIWFSNYGNRLRWYWCQPNDYASTTLAGISYANGTSMRKNFQYFYLAIAFADYGAVSSQISEINSKRYKDAKLRSPEEYPEIEPPEDDQAKKRRAKLLEKESKQKAIDVDDESTSKKEESASKKARGKGQGSESGIWTKEPLPAGHWQAFLRKAKKPRKEQLEEYHKKKLRETIDTHFQKETSSKKEEPAAQKGPGPDEAGSDPSSEEESESSSATDDPDGATHME
ncbi:unnamed protein product, partial [Symbiodinium sp. KB8]